jgi:hypothetical protein
MRCQVPESPSEALGGTLRDVTFRNIVARGENGVLLSGTAVERIAFVNVSLTVATLKNTSCTKGAPGPPTGCRDYRPRTPDGVVPCDTAAIYLEGSGSVSFDDTTVAFDGRPQPYWVPPAEGGLCTDAGAWAVRTSGGTTFGCANESRL